ncbi:hypothetical protein NKG99_14425 [Mesorhizobium sp. M1409]|uniref:hypothetical protein n=1 Tax=unclassified Mesorhizobium TaxID=325217 RepID=UPI0033381178
MAILDSSPPKDKVLIGAFFQVGSRKYGRASRTDKEMEQMAAGVASDIAALAATGTAMR